MKQKATFNVSVGMGVNVTMNPACALLLNDLVQAVADSEEILTLLAEKDARFDGGVPQEVFALALTCKKQAKTNMNYHRPAERSDRSEENSAA